MCKCRQGVSGSHQVCKGTVEARSSSWGVHVQARSVRLSPSVQGDSRGARRQLGSVSAGEKRQALTKCISPKIHTSTMPKTVGHL